MSSYRTVVEELAMVSGVRAALISAPDGVVVDSVVHVDVRADAVAAFGTAVIARALPVSLGTLHAPPTCLVIDAEAGRLCLTANSELAIVLLADRRAPIGRLRLALQRAMETLP